MSEAEAPLITEEAAERGLASSGSRRLSDGAGGQGSRKYRRRSDALAYGDRYQKAAALVDLVGSHSTSLCLSLAPLVLCSTLLCFAERTATLFAVGCNWELRCSSLEGLVTCVVGCCGWRM